MYRIRLVCEGPTDLEVFRAILDAHLGGREYQITMIQPDGSLYGGDAGPHGGGWKGVRGWCREIAKEGIEDLGVLEPDVDLLVIHVDADIAYDAENDVGKPCPPPDRTVLAVESIVMGWLGVKSLPDRVILWVPSMATEAVILKAIFPNLPESKSCLTIPPPTTCVECVVDPASVLERVRPPKFVRRKDGKLKKLRSAYRDASPQIASDWTSICVELWTAKRLDAGLNKWIP